MMLVPGGSFAAGDFGLENCPRTDLVLTVVVYPDPQ